MNNLPIIDIGAIDAGIGVGIEAIVQQILDAYATTGFAYIVNHGVDPSLIDALFQASAAFHALPRGRKMAIELNALHRGFIPINTSTDRNSKLAAVTKPNQSESFIMMREADADDPCVRAGDYLAGPNQWPRDLPGFRDDVMAYHAALTQLGHKMCRAMALVLQTDVQAFADLFTPPTTFLRLLCYPPRPRSSAEDLYGSAPHTDFGFITFLVQDDIGGLQVRDPDGEWIDVPYLRDSFVMNAGDMLHRWSNGLLVSTPHRVVNRSGRARHSCAFFFDPHVTVEVAPLVSCISDARPRRFDGVVYGDFLRAELRAGYDKHATTR